MHAATAVEPSRAVPIRRKDGRKLVPGTFLRRVDEGATDLHDHGRHPAALDRSSEQRDPRSPKLSDGRDTGPRRNTLTGAFKTLKAFVGRRGDAKLSKDAAGCRSMDVSRAGPSASFSVDDINMKRTTSDGDLSMTARAAHVIMDGSNSKPVVCLRSTARSLKGWKHSDKGNEDEFLRVDDLFVAHADVAKHPPPDGFGPVSIYGVFDGHGGQICSSFVSTSLAPSIVRSPAWERLWSAEGDGYDGTCSRSRSGSNSSNSSSNSNSGRHARENRNREKKGNVAPPRNGSDHTPIAASTAYRPPADRSISNKNHSNGRRSSAEVGERLREEVMRQALIDGFRVTQDKFAEQAKAKGRNSGSTAVVALVFGRQVVMANLGDSEALFYNDNAWVEREGAYSARTKVAWFRLVFLSFLPSTQHKSRGLYVACCRYLLIQSELLSYRSGASKNLEPYKKNGNSKSQRPCMPRTAGRKT